MHNFIFILKNIFIHLQKNKTMRTNHFLFLLLACAQLFFFTSCEKDPIPCFTMSATTIKVGETLVVSDCSQRAKHQWFDKATPFNYTWDFGDGTTASGLQAGHTYSAPGVFTVMLTVEDKDKDKSATTSQSITVTRPSDISRSGKFIAFTSDKAGGGIYDIWLAQVNSDGSLATSGLMYPQNPYNLTTPYIVNSINKQSNWSADGKMLLFSSAKNLSGSDENIYAFFFNSDGSQVSATPSNIITQANAWDENPFFSPDGSKIIFDRRVDTDGDGIITTADERDIMMAYIHSGGNSITVDSVVNVTKTSNIDEANAKWSPIISVQRIAYERPPTPTANDHDIYVCDPFNYSSTNTDWNNPGSSGYPAWSPDCSFMVFETNSGNGGFWKIVRNTYPSQSGASDIAKNSGQDYRYPTVLPNGTLAAYIQQTTSTKGNIFIVSVNGGTSTALLPSSWNNYDNEWPAW